MKKLLYLSMFLLLISMTAFAELNLHFMHDYPTISPASPKAGDTVNFSEMFEVTGGSLDNLKCSWGIDSTTVGQKTFAHLNANATTGLSFDWTATTGNHYVWFRLDSDNQVGESNTLDNYIQMSFYVKSGMLPVTISSNTTINKKAINFQKTGSGLQLADKPNLIISEITITPQAPNVKDTIVIKATCKNIGTASAPASHVYFKIGGESNPPLMSIGAIPAGGKITIQRTIKLTTAQNYIVTVRADEKNEAEESKETDNEKKIDFNVAGLKII